MSRQLLACKHLSWLGSLCLLMSCKVAPNSQSSVKGMERVYPACALMEKTHPYCVDSDPGTKICWPNQPTECTNDAAPSSAQDRSSSTNGDAAQPELSGANVEQGREAEYQLSNLRSCDDLNKMGWDCRASVHGPNRCVDGAGVACKLAATQPSLTGGCFGDLYTCTSSSGKRTRSLVASNHCDSSATKDSCEFLDGSRSWCSETTTNEDGSKILSGAHWVENVECLAGSQTAAAGAGAAGAVEDPLVALAKQKIGNSYQTSISCPGREGVVACFTRTEGGLQPEEAAGTTGCQTIEAAGGGTRGACFNSPAGQAVTQEKVCAACGGYLKLLPKTSSCTWNCRSNPQESFCENGISKGRCEDMNDTDILSIMKRHVVPCEYVAQWAETRCP